MIERQANNILEWEEIRAQKAKREIALKKLPAGVRPIGCGELLDRLCDKVMVFVTEDDVKNSCNADQLCSGIKAGIEGAVHSIRELFDANCDNGFCLFLSDADNAFIQLTDQQLYGIQEFYGLGVLDSFLTLTEASQQS